MFVRVPALTQKPYLNDLFAVILTAKNSCHFGRLAGQFRTMVIQCFSTLCKQMSCGKHFTPFFRHTRCSKSLPERNATKLRKPNPTPATASAGATNQHGG